MFDLGSLANLFVWVIFEKYYVHNCFATLSQQNLNGNFLLVLI